MNAELGKEPLLQEDVGAGFTDPADRPAHAVEHCGQEDQKDSDKKDSGDKRLTKPHKL